MKWNDIGDMRCSVARTLSVIGDRWTMLILREAFWGVTRFDKLQKRLGVTRHILADRLASLVESEVLEKHPYQQRPLRYEYRLTPKGWDLLPVFLAITKWGDRWMDDGRGPPTEIYHIDCGERIEAACSCPKCGGELKHTSLMAKRGNERASVA